MTARFLVWSNQHRMWWGPDERGYTPWIEEAGRYDLGAARAIVAKATLHGLLTVDRPSWLPYRATNLVRTSDEVMVLAPEHLITVASKTSDQHQTEEKDR